MNNAVTSDRSVRRWMLVIGFLEVAALLVLFAWYGGTPPPDVNEAHYLAKAKHFWQPDWCSGDLFLESAEAHWAFYVTFGWLANWVDLSSMAWIGRISVWLGLAAGWVYLSRGITTRWGTAFLSGVVWLVLLHHAHLSGEWVIGGIEAKGPAFVLMLFGLGRAVRGDWLTSWWLWGAATAFHVLVGGWTIVVALLAWWFTDRPHHDLKSNLIRLAAGLGPAALVGLIGIVPALGLESQVDQQTLDIARFTYVFGRLPHHLVFSQFSPVRMLSFLALLLTWVMLLGSTRCDRRLLVVHLAALGSLGLCAIGVGLDRAISAGWSPERGASLLRFYWFREADVLVPIAVSLTAVRGLESWRAWPRSIQIAALPFGALGVLIVCGTVLEQRGDGRPRADQQTLPTSPDQTNSREILDDWRQVGQWFQNETPAGTLVITPREQQTFKWYAQRPEVVSWKDVPQDADGLVRWLQRNAAIYQEAFDQNRAAGVGLGLMIYTDETLRELGRKYGARYLVVTRYQMFLRAQGGYPSDLKIVYPAALPDGDYAPSFFVVLELNEGDDDPADE